MGGKKGKGDRIAITLYPRTEEERELVEAWRLWFRLQNLQGKKVSQAEWIMDRIKEWAKENKEQVETLKKMLRVLEL